MARSRLYRSQILQVNTRLKALDEIYIFSFAPMAFQISVIFQDFCTTFANFDATLLIFKGAGIFAIFRQIFANFFEISQKFQ